ncbi:MAG TPA: hypothetical protein VGN81_37430 [Pseudonocardiaceae bacterium]|jgi:branched-subunit amino acid transport protein AzlD
MSLRRVLLALVVMAVIGIVWIAVLVSFLLASVELLPLGVAAGVAAVLVIPGFLAGVATVSGTVRRRAFMRQRDVADVFRILPRWLRWSALVLFVAFWLSAATVSIGNHGDAEIVNGQYVLNNHGTTTVVDEATYARQRALPDRMALSVLGGFGAAGAALCLVAAARRRVA